MLTKEVLRETAKEMNKVMGLNPQIDLTVGEDDLLVFLKEAIKIIDRKLDSFSEATEEVIKEIQAHGEAQVVEEQAEQEKIEQSNRDSLLEQIEDAQKLSDLKEIAQVNDEFKSIRGKLSGFKLASSLRNEMLDILNGTPPEEDQQAVANRMHEEMIEKAPVNKGKKVKVPKEEPVIIPVKEDIVEEIAVEGRIAPSALTTKAPFNTLFTINESVLKAVKTSLTSDGYDNAFPIIAWNNKGEIIVIDGHTRLQAALEVGIDEVPVNFKEFIDEQDALNYAIHNQRDRRNISDAELLKCIELIDKPLTASEARKIKGSGSTTLGKTHKITAQAVGVGETKVQHARAVLSDEQAKEDVLTGKKSISKAAKEVREKKQPKEDKVKRAKKTRIESVAFILKEWAGTTQPKKVIVEEADIYFEENGGTGNLRLSEDALETVLEVLLSLNLIVVEDTNVVIPKWKK